MDRTEGTEVVVGRQRPGPVLEGPASLTDTRHGPLTAVEPRGPVLLLLSSPPPSLFLPASTSTPSSSTPFPRQRVWKGVRRPGRQTSGGSSGRSRPEPHTTVPVVDDILCQETVKVPVADLTDLVTRETDSTVDDAPTHGLGISSVQAQE